MTPQELDIFAQWSDRIQAGEVPAAPPRPQGVERNLVITEWDWSDATGFIRLNALRLRTTAMATRSR